jgi:hypothetical protein
MSGHVAVGQGHQRGGVPARQDYTGRVHQGGRHPGREERQMPGDDRVSTIYTSHSRPTTHHTYVHVDPTPRSHVTVIEGSGGSSKAASIALMILGIALTILGVCTLPFDPLAGILIGGFGILMTAAGAASYSALDG